MTLKPNFVFFGTPVISRIVLQKLVDAGYLPAAVVTNPDRPVGRKHVITPPPVKQFIIDHALSITILQPEKLSEIHADLSALAPDFFVVAAYTKIIPQSILDLPRLGTIGVHPSLLPLYRGASPIQTALLEGATETGMSLYLMDAKMDEGPVLAQRKLASYVRHAKNNEELSRDLFELGGDMLCELIPSFMQGSVTPRPQDHSLATFTKKISTEDAQILWNDIEAALSGSAADRATVIHQKVSAFTPEPGVWTMRNGRRMKLLATTLTDGKLVLRTVQYEGKTPTAFTG